MSNLLNDDNFDLVEDYAFQALLFYENLLASLDVYKNYYKDDDFGLGFDFLREWVGDNKVIVDFIAKNMVEEIFYHNDNMNFESLIHKYYKSGKVTKEGGVRNFIISYISLLDNDLSSYICCNLEIIKDIEKDIGVLESNWQEYIDSTNQKKVEILYQEVNNIIQDNFLNVRFTSYEIVMYIIKVLHLEDIFNKYDIYDTALDDEYIDICNMKMNKVELKCLNKIISFARKLFTEDVIDKTRNDYDNEYDEFKLLKFDPKIREKNMKKGK
jgi:hypothetical protein